MLEKIYKTYHLHGPGEAVGVFLSNFHDENYKEYSRQKKFSIPNESLPTQDQSHENVTS